jgi:exportin-5
MTLEIAEPLLLFCMHTISMRDNRCCGVALRVFRNIVPEFYCDGDQTDMGPAMHVVKHDRNDPFRISNETAHAIREFVSSGVLQACIGSLRDPHFVDSQKDIASLIATILTNYSPHTATPRTELQKIEGVSVADVEQLIDWVCRPGLDTRSQRGIVLEFFRDMKGVSVSQLGTLNPTDRKPAVKHTKMAQMFMQTPDAPAPRPEEIGGRQTTPDMQGVADMFAQDG